MRIKVDPKSLRQTKRYECAIRFVLGGVITVIAAFLAKKFGPGVGGLFLAFPAIFPASATLYRETRSREEGSKRIAWREAWP
jgi:Protein of unknown function (DUF3147)